MPRRTFQEGRARASLSQLEQDVMQVIWERGPASVEAVHAVVSRRRDLKETSIRTILRRLEQKGYLVHGTDGRAYVYRALEQSRSLAAGAVRQIIDRLCRGSVEELFSGMVDAKTLSHTELEALEGAVREWRRGVGSKDTKKGR